MADYLKAKHDNAGGKDGRRGERDREQKRRGTVMHRASGDERAVLRISRKCDDCDLASHEVREPTRSLFFYSRLPLFDLSA